MVCLFEKDCNRGLITFARRGCELGSGGEGGEGTHRQEEGFKRVVGNDEHILFRETALLVELECGV